MWCRWICRCCRRCKGYRRDVGDVGGVDYVCDVDCRRCRWWMWCRWSWCRWSWCRWCRWCKGYRRDVGDVDDVCDVDEVDVDDVDWCRWCRGSGRCYVDEVKSWIWQQFFRKKPLQELSGIDKVNQIPGQVNRPSPQLKCSFLPVILWSCTPSVGMQRKRPATFYSSGNRLVSSWLRDPNAASPPTMRPTIRVWVKKIQFDQNSWPMPNY